MNTLTKAQLEVIARALIAYEHMIAASPLATIGHMRDTITGEGVKAADALFAVNKALEAQEDETLTCEVCKATFRKSQGETIYSEDGDEQRWACPCCAEIMISVDGDKPLRMISTDIFIEDMRSIASLKFGERIFIGGGAAPECSVTRMRCG